MKCAKDNKKCEVKDDHHILNKRCKRYADFDANYVGSLAEERKNAKKDRKISHSVEGCSVHGNIDLTDCEFALADSRKSIIFVCFLIQFKFKLLNIEEVNPIVKNE